jgi:hypothetical protein
VSKGLIGVLRKATEANPKKEPVEFAYNDIRVELRFLEERRQDEHVLDGCLSDAA